jgi:hypothetical protein
VTRSRGARRTCDPPTDRRRACPVPKRTRQRQPAGGGRPGSMHRSHAVVQIPEGIRLGHSSIMVLVLVLEIYITRARGSKVHQFQGFQAGCRLLQTAALGIMAESWAHFNTPLIRRSAAISCRRSSCLPLPRELEGIDRRHVCDRSQAPTGGKRTRCRIRGPDRQARQHRASGVRLAHSGCQIWRRACP